MRSNRLVAAISIASISVCVAISIATAQSGQPDRPAAAGQPDARPGERRGGETPNVEANMKVMNRALGQLRDQVTDSSKKAACLKLIGDAQRGCIGAKNGEPHQIQKMNDETAKAKAAESFRRQLMAVARKLLDIEQSILDGKGEEAKAQIGEVLTMRDKGHEEFGLE
jgi:hypothetical protein